MKKKLSQILLVSALAIFTVIGIVSCGDKNVDMISKKWKMKSMDIDGQASMLASMDSTSRAMYENMMVQMKEKASFTFSKDGKFIVDMGFAKSDGTYKISKDGKTLTTVDMKDGKAGKEETMSIEVLSADKFVMKQKDPSGKDVTLVLVPATAVEGNTESSKTEATETEASEKMK